MNYLTIGAVVLIAYFFYSIPSPLVPGQKSLTLYWWSRCGHCLTFMPTFDMLGSSMYGVKLRKVEASQIGNEYEVNSFPTMVYRGADGVAEVYTGGRSSVEITHYLMSKA